MIDQQALMQALVRFGRTVGAAAVSAAVLALADLVAGLQLGPTFGPLVLVVLTAVLNALGKWLRGPDVPAEIVSGRGIRPPFGESIRSRRFAYFLPI